MTRRSLMFFAALITWGGCDVADAQRDTLYAEPEAEVEIPYTLDLDGDGVYDLELSTDFNCTYDEPTSSCLGGLSARVGEGAALLTVRDSTALRPGTEVGPYPDLSGFPSGELSYPHWRGRGFGGGAPLAAIHMSGGPSRLLYESAGAYYGLRVGEGERARYGWVLLSGSFESEGRIRPVAVVHAYALGAPGEVVRVAERP